MSKIRRTRGFALVDSLVAAAIVALMVPPLLQCFDIVGRRMRKDSASFELLTFANALLTTEAAAANRRMGSGSGSDGAFDWEIDRTLSPTPDTSQEARPGDLVELSVTVSYAGSHPAQPPVQLRTLVRVY